MSVTGKVLHTQDGEGGSSGSGDYPHPPALAYIRPRQRVPTSFLKSLQILHELAGRLDNLAGQGERWWSDALRVMRHTAFDYEKRVNPKGVTEIWALLHSCTRTLTSLEAATFLQQQGLSPRDTRQAYTMLVAHAEHAMQAKVEEIELSKLKTVLNEQPQEPKTKQQQRAEIVRLTRELQIKGKLKQCGTARDKY